MSHLRRFAAVSSVAVGLMLAAAAAEPPSSSAPEAAAAPKAPAAAPAKKEKPKMVCEETPQIGSHFKRKVCATPEAWEARRMHDQQEMQHMGDHASGCGAGANAC